MLETSEILELSSEKLSSISQSATSTPYANIKEDDDVTNN